MSNLSKKPWPEIAATVERIIDARTTTKVKVKKQSNGISSTETITRPFRFCDFTQEVGLNNTTGFGYVRGAETPGYKIKERIVAWCEKHFHNVKK